MTIVARDSATPEPDRAIDLVHLARQCLGDKALEHELLGLFERQAAQIVARLAQAAPAASAKARADLAHALKGSALAVGANRVARAAAAYEEATHPAGADGPGAAHADRQIEALRIAVEEARSAVTSLLAA